MNKRIEILPINKGFAYYPEAKESFKESELEYVSSLIVLEVLDCDGDWSTRDFVGTDLSGRVYGNYARIFWLDDLIEVFNRFQTT